MDDHRAAEGDRRSYASTATATATYYDALEDQLTEAGSRFSYLTAADTLRLDEPEELPLDILAEDSDDGGLDNRGYDSVGEVKEEVEVEVEEEVVVQRTAVTFVAAAPSLGPEQPSKKSPGKKQPRPKRRTWRKKHQLPPQAEHPSADVHHEDVTTEPAAAEVDEAADDNDDDYGGFRYRPAVGPPRPLLAASQQTVLLPPELEVAANGYELGGSGVHYYYDDRMLVSGSIPRCRFAEGSADAAAAENDSATITTTKRASAFASASLEVELQTQGALSPPPPPPPPQPVPSAVCCDHCHERVGRRGWILLIALTVVGVVCLVGGAIAVGVVLGAPR